MRGRYAGWQTRSYSQKQERLTSRDESLTHADRGWSAAPTRQRARALSLLGRLPRFVASPRFHVSC
jgi:hypothetical protein